MFITTPEGPRPLLLWDNDGDPDFPVLTLVNYRPLLSQSTLPGGLSSTLEDNSLPEGGLPSVPLFMGLDKEERDVGESHEVTGDSE